MEPGARIVGRIAPEVRELADAECDAWEAFVRDHPRATFFHQLGWKRVLEATFGYRPHYLAAWSGDRIRGVLPLFECRTLRGRKGLYSLPHTVYGGPLGVDRDAEEALLARATELGGRMRAEAIEFRNRHANSLDLPPWTGFVTFQKKLPGSADQVYRSFPKKAREAINQATKRHHLEADFAGDLGTFYDLVASSYQRLGTPVYSKRLFAAMLREFAGSSNILLVRHEGVAVAGVLSMTFRGVMMPLYSGEAADVVHLKSSTFKYYRLMEHAVSLGLTAFDFGRSRIDNAGVVKFKSRLGFETESLPYQRVALVGNRGASGRKGRASIDQSPWNEVLGRGSSG